MELNNFININNITNFETLKTILESSLYNLKIKEDNDYPDLFLIHTQDNSDFSLKLVNECNGIILDKNTLKIVCYTFDKCHSELAFPPNMNTDNLYIEASLEGTLIRVYYHNNRWVFSTKKCIDSSKSKWVSNKNFLQLFNECLVNITNLEENLNKNHCYSFIITHPENNIIVKYQLPALYHISTRNMNTLEEIYENIGINILPKTIIDKHNLEETLVNIKNDKNLNYEGFIFVDNSFNRWKLKTTLFEEVRNLWGNTNNRFFKYLELRKNTSLLEQYLIYFGEDKNKFISYEVDINNFAIIILNTYIEKHITKKCQKVPFYFTKIIYKLHGDYFKDKIKTDFNKVMLTLLELDPKQICFMINNYNKLAHKVEIEKLYDETFLDMNVAE